MYTQRNEKIVKKGGSSSTINYSLLSIHSGMTLVELLAVVSIMVLLVAVSVPMFKPMLASQKTSGGAQTVSMALQRARMRSMMEEQDKSWGVEFERFNEGNESQVSIRMRLVKNANPLATTDNSYRVKVQNGEIEFYGFNTTSRLWVAQGVGVFPPNWEENVKADSQIQFGRQGRFYTLASPGSPTDFPKLAAPFDSLNHPVELPPPDDHPPVEFLVRRPPRPMLIPPIIMPRGTVVDLNWSGLGKNGSEFDSSTTGSVVIMFSRDGSVARVIQDGAWPGTVPRYPIHLCIGEWDRRMINSTDTWAEDGRNNIQMPSNFWVTIHSRTGSVRIAEMNTYRDPALAALPTPPTPVEEARKFATENFVDVGGF